MSKDKYRPSISADEVIRRDLPVVTTPGGSQIDGGGEGGPGGVGDGSMGDAVPSRLAPRNVRVASQKVYYSPEGQQFVEVTLEWDEVPGATEYLVRLGI